MSVRQTGYSTDGERMSKDYSEILDRIAATKDPKPKTPEPKKLISIEGGRHIAARDVEVVFRDAVETALSDCDTPAGFIVLLFDDEGYTNGIAHMGNRLPYSPDLFSEVARKQISNLIDQAARGE